MRAKKLIELALLTTVALIIFVVELQIPNPIPIPGEKLDLANIITVYAVYHYRANRSDLFDCQMGAVGLFPISNGIRMHCGRFYRHVRTDYNRPVGSSLCTTSVGLRFTAETAIL